MSPREEVATRPFEQIVVLRTTGFHLPDDIDASGIQGVYKALMAAEDRNHLICADLLDAIQQGRTPLLLTERKEHLDEFARRLEDRVHHLVVLHGGMGAKRRREIAERLEAISQEESCAILATGRYAERGSTTLVSIR